jgi:hypothetical protein
METLHSVLFSTVTFYMKIKVVIVRQVVNMSITTNK